MIVGAGQAAVQTVDTLRRRGFTGKITLIGEEQLLARAAGACGGRVAP